MKLLFVLLFNTAHHDVNTLSQWQFAIESGIEAQSQGRYREAQEQFRNSLSFAANLHEDERRSAASMSYLAGVTFLLGQADEAERLYRQALAIYERTSGQESRDAAILTPKLAQVYRSQARYTDAEAACRQALRYLEGSFNDMDLASTLTTLGGIQADRYQFGEAERSLRRALQLTERIPAEGQLIRATAFNEMGLMLLEAGRSDEAEQSFRRALQIREKLLGRDHLQVARTLLYLGQALRSLGNYRAAESLWQRVLVSLKASLSAAHPDVAIVENSLATLYSEQRRLNEAEPLFDNALRTLESVLGREHPDVAAVLTNIGCIRLAKGRPDEASELHARALSILERYAGTEGQRALVLMNLADTDSLQGRYETAESWYARALKMAEGSLGSEHPVMHTILYNWGKTLQKHGKKQEARILLERAEELGRKLRDNSTSRHRVDYRELDRSQNRR